ncbi:MAG TPA: exodeoxyribonuclease VII small subunit [Methylophilaceae bacterium]|jgi:exodeoxyribonuclease VII small subunit|nr:exodeoxyribonuclease VII small subunit [Methylophilaceae bacterium]
MQKKTPETPPNYEDAIANLEDIVRQMESENLPLEQSLNAYKRGAELLKACQQSLSNAEQEVRIISEANKLTTFNPEKA